MAEDTSIGSNERGKETVNGGFWNKTIPRVSAVLAIVVAVIAISQGMFGWLDAVFTEQKSELLVTGEVKDADRRPITGAIVTIDGYDFETRTRVDGQFGAVLHGVSAGEVITLRVHHDEYQSFSTDRLVQSDNEAFHILLKER